MSDAEKVTLSIDDDVARITVDNPPVNALSAPVRQGLVDCLATATRDANVRVIVLRCAGQTFIAGADIKEFGAPRLGPTLADVQATIENANKPVVAVIHGKALGGGLELALCAHFRIAARNARFGLPEVNIGILPGAGGTQRLPRLVGVQRALEIIVLGEQMDAEEALQVKLVDALAEPERLDTEALAFARAAADRPLRRVSALPGPPYEAEVFARFRAGNAKKFRGYDAPEACIQAIEAAAQLPFEEGRARERALYEGLASGPQTRAQRYLFFAERQAAKAPSPARPRPVAQVGVLGAGTMGGGIAMAFLNGGFPVRLVERDSAALDRGVDVIRRNYEASMKKGRLTQSDLDARMARLSPSLDIEAFRDCDLIVEAVFEDMALKQAVFAQLDRVAPPHAIIASNTSYLDVDAIAAATTRPQSVLGMHFFSPANVMRLLEIIRGARTADDVLATAMHLAKRIDKQAVISGVCPGFIGNRMLAQRRRESERLMLEGAPIEDIDRVLYDFGFPMGPFAMQDLAGLDIGWNKQTSASSSVREILCERGRWGQKTKAGYYDYDDQRRPTPSPVTREIIADFAQSKAIAPRAASDAEIIERCLYPMINEAAKILAEGVAARASDIDVVWVNGYGWPRYRGGPAYWANQIGLEQIVARLEHYQAIYGDVFAPAPLLVARAGAGEPL